MRDNKTANLLHLVSVLQEQHGPYPLGRQDLVAWLSDALDKTPGDAGVRRIAAEFPKHLASLQTE
jgi:hypothetical protein